MADVNSPGEPPENPYGYTGQTPARPPDGMPPQGGPPPQSGPTWQGGPPGHCGPLWQPSPEPTKRGSLWIPTIVGGVATLVLGAAAIFLGSTSDDAAQAVSGLCALALFGLLVAGIVLLFSARTRRWGGGVLLGFGIAVGLSLVVLAGLCVALIAGYDQSY